MGGRQKIEELRRAAMLRQIGTFDLMAQTTKVVNTIVKEEFDKHEKGVDTAVFTHGSLSRNEMTTYSDVDILFVGQVRKDNADMISSSLSTYGFGKVDEQGWWQQEAIKRYVKNSLIDGNKVLDARFISGDTSLQDWMTKLQKQENTPERAIKNIVFQRYYLEHYYSNRSTDEIPNVKYQNGGYRDLLVYNWFNNAMALYKGDNWLKNTDSERPKIELALKNILGNGIISLAQYERAKSAAEFVIMLRNEILHVNQGTKDRNITHLDKSTQVRVFDSASVFFNTYGIKMPSEVKSSYEMYRKVNYDTKMMLWETILNEEAKLRGAAW